MNKPVTADFCSDPALGTPEPRLVDPRADSAHYCGANGRGELLAYARKHRLRVRNLHDAFPVPETRRRGRRRSAGYTAERHTGIVCRDGYIDFEAGAGRIGWCVLAKTSGLLRSRVAALTALGATVTQSGATEAAGHAPASCIGDVVRILRAWRLKATAVAA